MTALPLPDKLPTTTPPSEHEMSLGRLPLSALMILDLPFSKRQTGPQDLTSIIDRAIQIAESTISLHDDASVSLSSASRSATEASYGRNDTSSERDLQ
ncbi:hypothetical protein IV203_027540 [Nitzschia inconspicua]|uniref:Uncharacterized protein n=1 Tax=Nitzschia inconspicua TaxID=303405 RepID=A0A9K3Q658_9STRA|nr:hypothetical protein IV203_027540 [Nitzschia inconspicua]